MTADRLTALKHKYKGVPLSPITFAVSPGRAGTLYLARWLSDHCPEQADIAHEGVTHRVARPGLYFRAFDIDAQNEALAFDPFHEWIRGVLDVACTRPVVETGHYAISAIPLLHGVAPQSIRLLLLHRHPVKSAGSHAIKGHYSINVNPEWAIYPTHPRAVYPEYQSRWQAMSSYEKELYRWLETTAYGLELINRLPDLPNMTVASDELFRSIETRRRIANFAGLSITVDSDTVAERNATTDRNREVFGIRDEWRRTREHEEVCSLAESLGYDLSSEAIGEAIRPYLVPDGIGPTLRRLTGYWRLRWMLGSLRKSLGLARTPKAAT